MHFTDTSAAQRIVFGPGTLARLGEEIAGLGAEKVLLITSPTYARNGVAERTQQMLAGSVGLFSRVRPHVPAEVVEQAVVMAGDAGAIVALGGGSAIGTGKSVVAALAATRDSAPPLVAIPTTYAGSEMTPVYGVTSGGHKQTATDPRVLARVVLYDPELTLDLPPALTAATGANAIAHCFEGLYSLRRTPLGSAAALAALPRLFTALPALLENGRDLSSRSEMLIGAHLAGVTLAHAGMALHHAIGHALGGAGVAHGEANAIVLPYVLRANAPAARSELAAASRVLGATGSDEEMAATALARTEDLFRRLPLPHRLREVGIAQEDLPALAAAALAGNPTRLNPQPVSTEMIEAILRAAW